MHTKQEDQVIYLKDLLFSVLYRWKRILIFCVILAVLFGGMKGISTYKAVKASQNAPLPQATESTEKTLLTNKLDTLQAAVDNQEAYLQESIFMQIDPYDFYKATLNAYISTDYQIMPGMDYQTPDLSNVILQSYANKLISEDFVQILAKKLDIHPLYVAELITVTPNDITRTLSVNVVHPTEEGAKALMEALLQQLDLLEEEFGQSIQAHQLQIYQQSVCNTRDTDLAKRQTQNIQDILDLYTSLEEVTTALSAIANDPILPVNTDSVMKSTVLFGIIGFLLGAVVFVAVIWVTHLVSNKVYSDRTLTNRTQVKVLGALNTIERIDPITRAFRKLDYRTLTESSTQAKLLAANVQNLCADAKHLLVTGSAHSDLLSEALKQAMPHIQISVCGSLLNDIAATNALSQCDCVLLVEKCDVSTYTDIQKTTEIIADNKKQLLGCVLLNG